MSPSFSHISRPWQHAVKKYLFYTTIFATIPPLIAASTPRFVPPEHAGFPALSLGDNFLSTIQSGDILLFNQGSWVKHPVKWCLNTFQKIANFGDYEHVGVVVVDPHDQCPYVIERTWRGTQVVPFEDRIAWSGSQDITVRTLHLLRQPETRAKAQEFLQAQLQRYKDELAEEENSLSLVTGFKRVIRWYSTVGSLLGVYFRTKRSDGGDSSVRFLEDMQDLAKSQLGTTHGDRDDFSDLLQRTGRNNTLGKSNYGNENVPISRVSLHGHLIGLLKELRRVETRITQHLTAVDLREQREKIVQQNQQRELSNLVKQQQATTKHSSVPTLDRELFQNKDDTTTHANSNILTPSEQEAWELPTQDILNLLKIRDLLYEEFDLQYDSYRQMTLDLSSWKPLYNPLRSGATAPFESCDLIARFYHHLRLIPSPTYTHLVPADVHELFPLALYQLADEARQGKNDLRKFDFSQAFEVLNRFAPTPQEFTPHDFRNGNTIYFSHGILGDEQFIVHKFKKPPVELRSGNGNGSLSV